MRSKYCTSLSVLYIFKTKSIKYFDKMNENQKSNFLKNFKYFQNLSRIFNINYA